MVPPRIKTKPHQGQQDLGWAGGLALPTSRAHLRLLSPQPSEAHTATLFFLKFLECIRLFPASGPLHLLFLLNGMSLLLHAPYCWNLLTLLFPAEITLSAETFQHSQNKPSHSSHSIFSSIILCFSVTDLIITYKRVWFWVSLSH